MFFVTAFLLGIGILFLVRGFKGDDAPTKVFGMSLLIAAIGTALITWMTMTSISV